MFFLCRGITAAAALLIISLIPAPAFAISVALRSSPESPGTLGDVISWHAELHNFASGNAVWFSWSVRAPGRSSLRIVRDFSPDPNFEWAPFQGEGVYEIEVIARDRVSGETASASSYYFINPVATTDAAVIRPTRHELVFIYSAPACADQSKFRVAFQRADDASGASVQFTPWLACNGASTMNAYVAGLRPSTNYRAWHQIQAADATALSDAPALDFRTGELRISVAASRVLQKPGTLLQSVLLQSSIFQFSSAVDDDGEVIWYYPGSARYLTRPEPGGYFFALFENDAGDDSEQVLRLVDLPGNIVLETNAARINEQLDARGMRHITSFHHEARLIPNGRILVLASTEQLMTDVQGAGETDILGDMILVLNRDLEVEWAWDAFDHLDPRRAAILNETCGPGAGGCPRFRLAETSNDWLHGNALQLTPDGHILYSARHQDWLIKIDYANGQGSGAVIWRLGKDGDFAIVSDDPHPWFSHQHDANFETTPGRTDRLMLFDNGNTRYYADDHAHSRGQVLRIDEASRTATLELNVDLGDFAVALGSAQKLANGNYHFNLGWMSDQHSQALEFDPAGQLVTQIETDTQQYRSFRMRSLYNSGAPGGNRTDPSQADARSGSILMP